MIEPLPVYIGYDIREHSAYLVCASTVEAPIYGREAAGRPGIAQPLNTRVLRREGLFTRAWKVDEKGGFWDEGDGRPFSTDFSHSRFLAPYVAARKAPLGQRGWVLFCDCDFMFRRRVDEILKYADPSKAVMVVPHHWNATADGTKMDGQVQSTYRRKLWSSLILWNLDHPANAPLTESTDAANQQPGSWLHGFDWLSDDLIGYLPTTWNHIPRHSPANSRPAAVHWSFGGPWMAGYYEEPYANEWRQRFSEIVRDCRPTQIDGNFATLFPLL